MTRPSKARTLKVALPRGGGIAALLAVCLTQAAAAEEVFKWVDEDGQVHYGDRPQHDAAEVLELDRPPAPDPHLQQRQSQRDRLLEVLHQEREDRRRREAEARAEAAERRERCAEARRQLATYREAAYIYETMADGERRILSGGERQAAEDQAQLAVNRWCD